MSDRKGSSKKGANANNVNQNREDPAVVTAGGQQRKNKGDRSSNNHQRTQKSDEVSSHQKASSEGGEERSSRRRGNGHQKTHDSTASNSSHSKSQPICKFYPNPGCKYGSTCKNRHVDNNESQRPTGRAKAHKVGDQGNKGENKIKNTQSQPGKPKALSQDIFEFLGKIKDALKKNTPFIITSGNEQIWCETFDAVAKTSTDGGDLLRMYLKLTDNQGVPKARNVLMILSDFLLRGPNPDKMRLVHSVVEQRLLRQASMRTIEDKGPIVELIDILDESRKFAKKRFVEQDLDEDVYDDCNKMLKDIIKKYKLEVLNCEIKVVASTSEGVEANLEIPISQRWISSPTLGWLLDESWMHASDFQDVYPKLDDYIKSMQETWTLLTFYWGAAAFWPKCGSQDNGKACNNPLLHVHSSRSQCKFCKSVARWSCFRRNHDSICDRCLKAAQDGFLGPSGNKASTDVYDSLITSVAISSENRVIHCTQLRCRKPPHQTQINWKTSYRLQCAQMVAVIPVNSADSPLGRDCPLFWGEIVPHSQKESSIEHVKRGKGEISIRLLGKNDCDLFGDMMDEHQFSTGKRIVVVDMRVFVPEVISVLATLTSKLFKSGLKTVAFQSLLLDSTNASNMLALPTNLALKNILFFSIKNSTISAVKKLSDENKQILVEEIWSIPQVQSLDETQGRAFASALLQSLHTVQGPPGSGKSYVGVCLVLALTKIRSFVIRQGGNLGPIIALSYKNHALDEFLLDTLHSKPELSKSGNLVRLGKPDHEELADYTEKSNRYEFEARKILEHRLEIMKFAKIEISAIQAIMRGVNQSAEIVIKCLVFCFLTTKFCENKNLDSEDFFEFFENLVNIGKNDFVAHWKIANQYLREYEFLRSDEMLPILMSSEHWLIENNKGENTAQRFRQVFQKFLSGDTPPPRCSFHTISKKGKEMRCKNCVVVEGCEYCDETHRCTFNVGDMCIQSRTNDSQFCKNHNCLFDSCMQGVLVGRQYCTSHSCPICLDCAMDKDRACANHTCQMPNCLSTVVEGLIYCHGHLCSRCVDDKCVSNNSNCITNGCCQLHKCALAFCDNAKDKSWCGEFCRKHSCKLCGERAEENSAYCSQHKCSHGSCSKAKVALSSFRMIDFCEDHACKVCAFHDFDNIGYAIHNGTCELHPCCPVPDQNGLPCGIILSDTGQEFCPYHLHSNILTCQAIAKSSKKQCKSIPEPGSLFCKNHRNSNTSISTEAPPDGISVHTFPSNLFTGLPKVNTKADDSALPSGSSIHQCVIKGCKTWTTIGHNGWLCEVHCMKSIRVEPLRKDVAPSIAATGVTNKVNVPAKERDILVSPMAVPVAIPLAVPVMQHEKSDAEYAQPHVEAVVIDDVYEGGLNIDEMDYIEEEGDEENVNTMNNQEIYREESDDEEEQEGSDGNNDFHSVESDRMDEYDWSNFSFEDFDSELIFTAVEDFINFDWEGNAADRLRLVYGFVSFTSHLLKVLLPYVSDFIDDARRAKAEANGMILKRATVIGGTVVGAVKRLPALRAAEPFAVIVEEACEVMEPTLISILAIESLQKLELIGDHRQLPAFVNQCWYNIASVKPKLKKSLFERIVLGVGTSTGVSKQRSSAHAHHPICTILDVQRRMRSSISELTKHEYADIVLLKDHERTATQCVGDRLLQNPDSYPTETIARLNKFKTSWANSGRSVPGIGPNVYFWDLEHNAESKAKVGLSACNENEAKGIVQLIKYLHYVNGVPLECITVITPYQGQKRTLVDLLRKENVLPKPEKSNPTPAKTNQKGQQTTHLKTPTLTVSTVDRYQGDENDIVILSLVRVNPGNRFVGLLNRFIVAASRARLGFYIFGSRKAVSSVSSTTSLNHWDKFLQRLENIEASPDNDKFNSSRVGHDLPICCPQHRLSSTLDISSKGNLFCFPTIEDWNETLCDVSCEFKLKCSHQCSLPCHSYDPNKHETYCKKQWKRPCEHHTNVPIICGDIHMEENENIGQAFHRRWKCTLDLKQQYPTCEHSFTRPCHEMVAHMTDKTPWPLCEVRVEDYPLPCGHYIKSPRCFERQKYMLGDLPECSQKVEILKQCGEHRESILCCNVQQEKARPTLCKKNKMIQRPRCSHEIFLPCCDGSRLLSMWRERLFQRLPHPLIEEGIAYGPSEELVYRCPAIKSCTAKMTVKRQCGHVIESLECSTAFQLLSDQTLTPCQQMVASKCLFCNAPYKIPCSLLEEYERWSARETLSRFRYILHVEDASIWGVEETFFKEAGFSEQSELWRHILMYQCSSKVLLKRSCSHVLRLNCHDLVKLIAKQAQLPNCKETVQRTLLKCGHQIQSLCCNVSRPEPLCIEPTAEKIIFPCKHEKVPKHCGELHFLRESYASGKLQCEDQQIVVVAPCQHPVSVVCHKATEVRKIQSGSRLVGNNVVRFGVDYCLPCGYQESVQCREFVEYVRACGHVESHVLCSKAIRLAMGISQDETPCHEPILGRLLSKCGHEVSITCSEMQLQRVSGRSDYEIFQSIPCLNSQTHQCSFGHGQTYPCRQSFAWTQEEVDRACKTEVIKKCVNCNVNDVSVACKETVVYCHQIVTVQLPHCGHFCSWNCESGCDPRNSFNADSGIYLDCRDCILSLWEREKEIDLSYPDFQQYVENVLTDICQQNNIVVDKSKEAPIELRSIDPYERARTEIINRYCKALENGKVSQPWIVPPLRKNARSLQEYIKQNYKLVFLKCPLDADLNQISQRKFIPAITPFGQGLEVKEFSRGQLLHLATEGDLKVIVALAYQLNPLTGHPLFLKDKQIQDNSKDRNEIVKANQLKERFQIEGYDCSSFEEGKSMITHVFWNHHAVIPLRMIQVQLHKTCSICMDDFPDCPQSGAVCPNKHFVCWGEYCMGGYIAAANEPESSGYMTEAGMLICPNPDCKKDKIAFDFQLLCSSCPGKLFPHLNALQIKVCADKKVRDALEEARKKHEREIEEMAKLDEESREVIFLKKKIENEILIPRCPNQHPFMEFSDCFAVTCLYPNCGANFCAWCEKDCGEDAHSHVAHCRYGNGNVFGHEKRKEAKKLLENARNRIRGEKIYKLLETKSPAVRERVLRELAGVFKNIGLKL